MIHGDIPSWRRQGSHDPSKLLAALGKAVGKTDDGHNKSLAIKLQGYLRSIPQQD